MPRPNNRYYDLLEVRPEASRRGLEHAYHRVSERLQRKAEQGDAQASRTLMEVEQAWGVLQDHEHRSLYDRFGERAFEPGFRPPGGAPPAAIPTTATAPPAVTAPPTPTVASPAPTAAPPPTTAQPPRPEAAPATRGGPSAWDPPHEPVAPAAGSYSTAADGPSLDDLISEPVAEPEVVHRDDEEEDFVGDEAGNAQARVVDGVLEVRIPFRTACLGGEAEVVRPDRSHEIEVPVGTADGDEAEINGVPVRFRVAPDRVFSRDGRDLSLTMMIEHTHATRGVEASVPTLEGHVRIRIPKGVRSGQKLRLAGKGVPIPGEHGDLLVEITVLPRDTGRVRGVGVMGTTSS